MAITKLSDVVNAANMGAFMRFFGKAYHDNSAFLKSGIAAIDPAIQARINEAGTGGYLVNMPFWGDLMGDEEVITDTTGSGDSSLTVNKIAADKDVAVITRRAKAFGITDLAVDLAGDDPLGWIASRLGAYWARRDEAKLLATLKGVFTASTGAGKDLIADLSGSTLSKTTMIMAAQKLGMHKGDLIGIAMHSAVEAALAGLETTSCLYTAGTADGVLSKYCGKSIVMDDNLRYNPTASAVDGLPANCAEIYLFGRGAVALGDAKSKVPFEVGRDPLKNGGEEFVVSRHAGIAHIRGIAYAGTDKNPSNTVLGTAGSWHMVYDKEDIRVVKAIVKIA